MTVRKNFDFTERHNELLKELRIVCDLKHEVNVVEEALVLLGWAIGEVRQGRKIGTFDEKEKILREISTTALINAARHKAPAA
jgi:uncharacterized protein YwlG (UPF0340 family)